ncbi:MAG: hypothetical protein BGN94_13265 [Rhizobiales bacterium 68-8]|nr:MAG: hypothetical protein BGN94_13265 [Rhizobiales bacterium 68-8]
MRAARMMSEILRSAGRRLTTRFLELDAMTCSQKSRATDDRPGRLMRTAGGIFPSALAPSKLS